MEEAGVKLIAQNINVYIGDLKSAERATEGFVDATEKGSRRIDGASEMIIGGLRRVGEIAVNAFLEAGRAAVAFIGDSVTLAGEFDQTMSVLQETSGATNEELDQLRATAKALGSDLTLPATSAVDAGDAMLELAKAGFTVQESMDAAKGVLQLAAAAQIEEAEAAEINANALMAFNLEAKDSIFISDLLAASANASSIDATDMADTYKMAAAVFSAFQGPVVGSKDAIIDLTTAAALLGNAGIKGSDAGTALKQSLLQLTGPSQKAKDEMRGLFLATMAEGDAGQNLTMVLQGNAKARAEGLAGLAESAGATAELGDIAYDAAGNMRPFEEILRLTAQATATMSQEQRNAAITSIFGADAARAILVLMQQGPEAWDKMTVAVTEQGAAQDLAAAQTKGFKGALEGAKSQVETLQLTIGEALTPVLAELLNKYVSPGIAALTDLAGAVLGDEDAFNRLSPALKDVVGFIEETAKSIDDLIVEADAIIKVIGDVVGSFSNGASASDDLANAVDDLSGVWEKAIDVAGNVMSGYQSIAESVLPIVTAFVDEHGEEISAFFKTTWDSIMRIVSLALDLYNSIVPPILDRVNDLIVEHGDSIQVVLGGAWDVISGLITGALTLIEGTIRIALDVINGDWEQAWTDLQIMSAGFVENLLKIITGFLDIVAGFMGTSLEEIGQSWADGWNSLVDFVSDIDWSSIGAFLVTGIRSGVSAEWDSFVDWMLSKADELYQAFLDLWGIGSPAKEWMPVGAFSVQGIMQGFSEQWPALTKLVDSLGEDLIQQAKDLGMAVQNAIGDAFGATASIDRQIAKNLDALADDVLPEYQQFTQGALKMAEQQARAFLDPAEGARFFQLRSKQILEFADLQQRLAEEEDSTARKRIQDQMNLINAAQTAELKQFESNLAGSESAIESIMASMQAFLMSSGVDENGEPVGLPGITDNETIREITGWLNQLTTPAANPWAMAGMGSSTTYNQQRQYTMPVYTNQSPEALQQSMALMGAMYP